MKVGLIALNAKYIHKNLAIRWLYQASPFQECVHLQEFTIKDKVAIVADNIINQAYDYIGFSVYIWNFEIILELIQIIKARQPDVVIIVGGPEVSFESYDLIHQNIDAICIGEGEISFWEYIRMKEKNQNYEIPGIYTKDYPNKKYQKVPLSYLETLENPYFMDMDQKDMGNRYLYFETSRGCPYHCEYCLSSCDNEVRIFSKEYIINLLSQLKDSNVKQVKLLDRTFNMHPQRALEIAKYMNQFCINQIFQFEIVAETLSPQLLEFFEMEADANRFRFEIGVQSFHKPTLEAVGRIQNNKRLLEVLHRLQKNNIVMHVDLIAGLPYEDFKTFQLSFNQLFAIGCSEIQMGILKVLKGTKLKQKSSLFEMEWETQTPYTILKTKWLSKDELLQIQQVAHAVEKFWNSGKCRGSILILQSKYHMDAFTIFRLLGKYFAQLSHPYSVKDLFSVFFQAFNQIDEKELIAILAMDYFKLFKQRPPLFSCGKLEEDIKDKIRNLALENHFNARDLYHYTTYTYAYKDEICYQMIQYNKQQTFPKRFIINKEITTIKEITI